MKKFLILFLSFILTLGLVGGCTEYTQPTNTAGGSSSGGSSSGGTGGSSSGETEGEEGDFSVTLVFPSDTTTTPSLTDIYAVWTADDGSGVYSAYFNDSGVAYCSGLDGEYTITISAAPEGYTYDPNSDNNAADNDNKNASIYLYPLRSFTGAGTGLKTTERASCSVTGAYRITFTEAGQVYYFAYTPQANGTYTIKTLVDVTENEVNPTITKYYPTTLNPWTTYTDGGASGSYTYNVKIEIKLSENMQGNSYLYGVSIDCINSEYPRTVDILIEKDGEYTNADMYAQYGGAYKNVYTTEDVVDYSGYTLGGSFTLFGDYNGNLLSSEYIVYNKDDGYYYIDTTRVEGETHYDVLLYFIINSDTVLSTEEGTGFLDGTATYYRCSVQENGTINNYLYYNSGYNSSKPKSDSNAYLMLNEYIDCGYKCTNGGSSAVAYPVNNDIRQFLQNVSISNQLFWDGAGWLESEGYTSNEDDQWLFACGFFS